MMPSVTILLLERNFLFSNLKLVTQKQKNKSLTIQLVT